MFCVDLSSGLLSLEISSPPEYRRAREKQLLLKLNQDFNNYLRFSLFFTVKGLKYTVLTRNIRIESLF